jgi:hypothetical protein
MTIANINIGASANDGTGDTLRHGFQIVNNNFSYVSSIIGSTSGNITANYFIGNGSTITSLTGANVTGNVASAVFSYTAGTVTTNAQPNINSLGTLNGLTLSGNITGSNGNVNLININGIKSTVAVATGNLSGNANVAMTAEFSRIRYQDVNANVVVNFLSNTYPIETGIQRTVFIRNRAASTVYVTLPTAFNNKGTTLISLGSSITGSFVFTSIDSNAANVITTVANN